MGSPAAGTVRVLRAGLLTAVTLVLSLLAHQVGGGTTPAAAVVSGVTLLVGLEAYVLTRRRLRPASLLATLGAGQLVLHQVFMASSAHPAGHVAGHPGHAGHPVVQLDDAAAASAGSSWGMVLAHAAATIALAVLLASGEAVLWRLWCRLTSAGLRLLGRVAPPPPVRPHIAVPDRPALPSAASVLLVPVSRRGPPLAHA